MWLVDVTRRVDNEVVLKSVDSSSSVVSIVDEIVVDTAGVENIVLARLVEELALLEVGLDSVVDAAVVAREQHSMYIEADEFEGSQ